MLFSTHKERNPFVIILVGLSTLYLLVGLILYYNSPPYIYTEPNGFQHESIYVNDYKFKDNTLLGPLYNWLLASKKLPSKGFNYITGGIITHIILLLGLIINYE